MAKQISFKEFIKHLKDRVSSRRISKKQASASIRGKIASISRRKKRAIEQERILRRLSVQFSKRKRTKKKRN